MTKLPKQSNQNKSSHRERILTMTDASPNIRVIPEDIPKGMRDQSRWVCWRWVKKGKKWTKVPFQNNGRSNASVSDPLTWSSFGETLKAHKNDPTLGIGFVFNGDGIIGVDIDDCRNPGTGEIAEWAWEIINPLDSYTEVSPSGTGVKIFIRGDQPKNCRRKFNNPSGGAVEIYSTGRFFVVTGQQVLDTPNDLKNASEALAKLVETCLSWAPEKKRNEPATFGKSNLQPMKSNFHDREIALAALKVLDPDADYQGWLNILMACHSVDPSDAMLNEVDAWSRVSCKYTPGDVVKRWTTFDSSEPVLKLRKR